MTFYEFMTNPNVGWFGLGLLLLGLVLVNLKRPTRAAPVAEAVTQETLPPPEEALPARLPAEMELAMKQLGWKTRKEGDGTVILSNARGIPLVRLVTKEGGTVVWLNERGRERNGVAPEVARAMPLFATQSAAWQKRALELWMERTA